MTHKEYADGLRILAQFIESHEEIPLPCSESFGAFIHGDKESQKAQAIKAAHSLAAVATVVKKENYESHMQLVWDINSLLRYQVWFQREAVCEQVQVGTRIVPATPEMVLPATAEREEPVYEWKCAPILAGVE